MKRGSDVRRRRGPRPSTWVLLSAPPFALCPFLSAGTDRRALAFVLLGIGATFVGSLAAGALGLVLAARVVRKAGPASWWRTARLAGRAAVGSLVAFVRPTEHDALFGDIAGGARVASVQGAASRSADRLRGGTWGSDEGGAPGLASGGAPAMAELFRAGIVAVRDIARRARAFQASAYQTLALHGTGAMRSTAWTLAASSLGARFERRTSWGK